MSEIRLITLPIGNFDDITLSALSSLRDIKYFFAEDTRVFKEYLSHYKISYEDKIIDSFHDHSDGKVQKIINIVKEGHSVGIVSDAGSPIISDPAYPIVKEAYLNNIELKTSSGITSVICALELSGLPSNPFHFWGFVGRTESDKKSDFKKMISIYGTHIFFESPHRIFETIECLFGYDLITEVVILRELTKKFQSYYKIDRNNLLKIKELIIDKGEFVVLFRNDQDKSNNGIDELLIKNANEYIEGNKNTKSLAKILSQITGKKTQDIYNKLIINKE